MAKRLDFEKQTVRAMLRLYCKDQHHTGKGLCQECQDLENYALARLAHCKFGEQKPTCGKCPVHCYKPDMRQRMLEVMRYAGPKMVFSHPAMALRHLVDGFRFSKK
ncbi:nitrous oxide-stimulated promoter family protein [Desulfosporosinus sp. PR]|uniref:nitrous oxide-stimulated promoter family protein n=1 Tax=Candidatus Desulfosporosinus nitrosoreducens TaxID=3401928 RepID=UPI0027EA6251|nr:nitrous oxide-stimulated promoter family protein [Desulfosporosinus sp. PR]MDQ7095249.1 nitrous oxide-stimulated promoter family protein [Desulfosporosinus sp. PR]